MIDRYKKIDIKNEKVNHIINSAFEVFVKNNFEKASTNSIVKLACVSRGLLYHYFIDKQDLFNFLLEFSVAEGLTSFRDLIDWENSDLFDRFDLIIDARIGLLRKYPYMLDFIQKYQSYLDSHTIRMEFDTEFPGYRDKFYHYKSGIENVKAGIDHEKMINIIKWTIKGAIQSFIEYHRKEYYDSDINKLQAECHEYIDFFKNQFCKKAQSL